MAPPDLALIAALKDGPGAGAVLTLVCAAVMWRANRKARSARMRKAPTALPAPKAELVLSPPPAEPRLPPRADCLEAEPEPRLPHRAAHHSAGRSPERDNTDSGQPAVESTAEASERIAEGRAAGAPSRSLAAKAEGKGPGAKSRKSRSRPPRPLDETLSLTFEPLRFSATLAHAVLPYRLSVTNGGEAPLGPVTIGGDMVAADVAAPPATLSARDAAHLPNLHTLPALAPGETVALRGELRLPLGDIVPLRLGLAALMVPLVRLNIEVREKGRSGRAGAPLSRLAQFVVGEPDEDASERLHPFRLDLGPRSWAVAALGGVDLVA